MSAESAVRKLGLISMRTELGVAPGFDPQSGASLLPPTMQLKGPSTGARMICGEGLLSLPPDRIHSSVSGMRGRRRRGGGTRLEVPALSLIQRVVFVFMTTL